MFKNKLDFGWKDKCFVAPFCRRLQKHFQNSKNSIPWNSHRIRMFGRIKNHSEKSKMIKALVC